MNNIIDKMEGFLNLSLPPSINNPLNLLLLQFKISTSKI